MRPYGHEGFSDVFFDRLWSEWRKDVGEEWRPKVDFYEKDGNYYLTAEIPGLNKDDIDISFDSGCLTISGKKKSKIEEEGADYYIRETSHGTFYRACNLPKKINEDNVQATYKDGLLTLIMPIEEGSKVKKIEIR